jgi:uncharacterized surface protein with fasciclin (FAS1) repeats
MFKKTLFVALLVTVLAAFAVPAAFAKAPAKEPSIVDVAIAANTSGPYAGQFDTLISLLVANPDILQTLDSKGQYTVFAPTDGAFDKLFAALEAAGVTPDAATVKAILLYHVAHGQRYSGDVVSSDRIRTLNGGFLFPMMNGSTPVLGYTDSFGLSNPDYAGFVALDIPASNGVIHAIDTVLLP